MIDLIPAFELSRPATIAEALRHIGDGGTPYAGGTELIAAMRLGLMAPPHLIDLKRVTELRGIAVDGGSLTIGAAARHDEAAVSADVRAHAPMLAEACSRLGNMRVRATGTIGGNLCFADHRSDVATALFALDAEVVLRSAGGTRTVPIDGFVLGMMETDRAQDELLAAVRVPLAGNHHVYLRHQPSEYPTACVAMTVPKADPAGPVKIVIGAIGERPQAFTAPSLDGIDLDAVLPALDVIEDLNGSEDYKRHLAGVFIRRAAATLKETIDE